VDATDWRDVFVETGDPVPGDERPDRYVEWLELTRYDDGWLIQSAGAQEDPQC
jgi:desulfoferrodoxin (superoxide reductase-like protein)